MMNESIYDMSVSILQKSIEQKEKEYREAIKAKKVFWEVKIILDQQRALEKELLRKKTEQVN